MKYRRMVLMVAMIPWFAGLGLADPQNECRGVEDIDGDVIKVIDAAGEVTASQLSGIAQLCSAAPSNTSASSIVEVTVHTDETAGTIVDENGHIRNLDGSLTSDPSSTVASGSGSITIDWMTTTGGYTSSYAPGGSIGVVGRADTYYLSDGSSWNSGAGTHWRVSVPLERVEVIGDTVRYVLHPPADGIIYRQTDYNAGDHSAQGSLGVAAPLEIEATIGSSTAVMRGVAEIVSNDATWYGEPRFNYYSSIVGSLIPFEVTYTMTNGTWTAESFDSSFQYRYTGEVDFANPVTVPELVELGIVGSAQVPDGASTPFVAVARFDNDVLRNVTGEAVWSVEPTTIASIESGVLTTQEIETEAVQLTIHAEYTQGQTLTAEKTVLCVAEASADLPLAWEMYQGDHRHTGLSPIPVEPDVFSLRWQRAIGAGRALNPVTGADGKVFVSSLVYFSSGPSLWVLDDRDGEVLWSEEFDDVFSVNPPSYAYGNLYIQTGNHGSDTYLHAYNADTGEKIFQSPHSAQWERYYAPTIYQGSVYVNGGYYGGMYAFDAFSGQQLWFRDLPQYDEWTPALDTDLAFAYVGGKLFAVSRLTGVTEYTVTDPNFDWGGWSMDLAPVLGGMNDLLVIHDGRLLSFDLQSRSIRYEVSGTFRGQPSVAAGVVYAITYDGVVAIDQQSGDQLWSWPSGEQFVSNLVVTDTHVFGATADDVYAIELLSHTPVWSFPVSGHLTLSEEVLYVASSDGLLTAINMPEYTPGALDRILISGPTKVSEFSEAQYTATAYYDDGRVRDRTDLTLWEVQPADGHRHPLSYASFDSFGVMTTNELLEPTAQMVVSASYTEGDVTRRAVMDVELQIGVTIQEFVLRNVNAATAIKLQLLSELESALIREHAARQVAADWIAGEIGDGASPNTSWQCLAYLDQAIALEESSQVNLEKSVESLARFLQELNARGTALPQQDPVQALPRKGALEFDRR